MNHPTRHKNIGQKLIWHLVIAGGAILISLLFSLLLQGKLFHENLGEVLILTFIQLELFIWLGFLFFQGIKPDQPKYTQKIVFRLLLFYLSVMAIAFVLFLGIYTFYFIRNGAPFSLFLENFITGEFRNFVIAMSAGFALGSVFFFYTAWNDAVKRAQKLKEEKLIFQYETLKNQVNPHFLFNSLNTLSSLVSSDSNLSEQFIQKLSSVYRYVLENKDKELVPLATELEFVSNFFYLQKIRDQEKINLNIETDGESDIYILPVSLQMLAENALKHNRATRKEPLNITIHFEGLDKLVVRNNLQKKSKLEDSQKVGLKNLNERCRLILKREIEVKKTNEEFVVKVPVKLKSIN